MRRDLSEIDRLGGGMSVTAPSGRRRSRSFGRGLLAMCGILLTFTPAAASAQEPLYIRIRPLPDGESARAARELLWARRQAHARAVIESVCTGCLNAWSDAPPPAPRPGPDPDRVANLAVPTGLELDPGSGASDTHPEP
jgi:hypothetical protein